MKILVTGSAGFIGFHLSKFLCEKYKTFKVVGIDNINNFYSINLKQKRLTVLKKYKNFIFKKIDLIEKKKLSNLFKKNKFDIVIHLAAQAGVRDSIKIPDAYFKSNFLGFLNLTEISKKFKIKKFIFASSSSVYGDKKKFPLNEIEKIFPKNIYAATKKINEDIAKDLSLISNTKFVGLRFFTVYGNYGRPDMLIYKFLNSIFSKKKFYLYNYGRHFRDYTHIDDVLNIMDLLIKKKMRKKFEIFNICSNNPIDISKVILFILKYLKLDKKIQNIKRNKIEVLKTHGENKKILNFLKTKISKNIYEELPEIIDWYKENKLWKL